MSITKSVTKWWWGWEPEKIEDWLEQMESEGWHLYNATGIGIKFHFTHGEPKKIRYCADYQSSIGPEYKQIFQDTGWELVYSSMGWYIWRMEYVGERPDIYTDIDSLLERNKRLITILGVVAAVEVFAIIITATSGAYDQTISQSLIAAYSVLISFMGYSIYKLLDYNNSLKAKKKL